MSVGGLDTYAIILFAILLSLHLVTFVFILLALQGKTACFQVHECQKGQKWPSQCQPRQSYS